jgi:hypothetical protein
MIRVNSDGVVITKRVVSSAGIHPILGFLRQSSLYRVVVDVIQLDVKHLLGVDHHVVESRHPDLRTGSATSLCMPVKQAKQVTPFVCFVLSFEYRISTGYFNPGSEVDRATSCHILRSIGRQLWGPAYCYG